jgi:hypothetical protein
VKLIIIQLPDFLHEYLLEVQRRNTHNGMEPEELTIAAQLWKATTANATVVADPETAPPAADEKGGSDGPGPS